jgi:hypothetical protein
MTSLAMGQQTGASKPPAQPQRPSSSSSVVRSSSTGVGINSMSRQTDTRTTSPGREVSTQTIEVQGNDGRFRTAREATTETVGIGTKSVQSTETVYGTTADGRRILVSTTQANQEQLPDGTTRTVEDIRDADLNGGVRLSQRQVVNEKVIGRNVKQTDTSIYRPGLNVALREDVRLRETERQVSPDVVQTESTRAIWTANGQFQTVETKNREVRKTGTTGSTEEEVVNRVDDNGVMHPFERSVSRQSTANGKEEVVAERYAQAPNQPAGQLQLKERAHTTTIKTADGGEQRIHELERANPVPNGQLRVVERTVETVRSVGPGQWETDRQVFALDVNGRLVPSTSDRGQESVTK